MAKYKVYVDGEPEDEVFDNEEEAEEYASYLRSCSQTGAELLHMSNPGDYEYDEETFEGPEVEVWEEDD